MNTAKPEPALNSLEAIVVAKAQVLAELRESRVRMSDKAKGIFAPAAAVEGRAGKWMGNIERAIAIYDGAKFGIKVMRRLRLTRFFRRKR